MIPLDSKIEGYKSTYNDLLDMLQKEEFVLGSGYTYEHGYFDKVLDNEADIYRYYLRIPAEALNGDMDNPDTSIRLGKPFVIKHEVLTGNDPSADVGITSSLVNQFSKPIPSSDSTIPEPYIQRAKKTIKIVEQLLPS